jgi:CRP/FNR family transcriptional regulator
MRAERGADAQPDGAFRSGPSGRSIFEAFADTIELRPQQRLPIAALRQPGVILVRSGALAVDAVSGGNQRQILDFLVTQDLLLAPSVASGSTVSFRALTKANLTRLNQVPPVGSELFNQLLLLLNTRMAVQHARANIHLLMLGRLESEARVASFLMLHARRTLANPQPGALLALPMSRDDIADYLAMNSDTLSRIMARFEERGIVERKNRHAIWLRDCDRLATLTPIAHMIRSAC